MGGHNFDFPYQLDYLCKDIIDYKDHFRNVIIPLSWYGLGTVTELLEWSISRVHRFNLYTSDESFQKDRRKFL